MQCLANADMAVASGILGVAATRVGLRQRLNRADRATDRPPGTEAVLEPTDEPAAR